MCPIVIFFQKKRVFLPGSNDLFVTSMLPHRNDSIVLITEIKIMEKQNFCLKKVKILFQIKHPKNLIRFLLFPLFRKLITNHTIFLQNLHNFIVLT